MIVNSLSTAIAPGVVLLTTSFFVAFLSTFIPKIKDMAEGARGFFVLLFGVFLFYVVACLIHSFGWMWP